VSPRAPRPLQQSPPPVVAHPSIRSRPACWATRSAQPLTALGAAGTQDQEASAVLASLGRRDVGPRPQPRHAVAAMVTKASPPRPDEHSQTAGLEVSERSGAVASRAPAPAPVLAAHRRSRAPRACVVAGRPSARACRGSTGRRVGSVLAVSGCPLGPGCGMYHCFSHRPRTCEFVQAMACQALLQQHLPLRHVKSQQDVLVQNLQHLQTFPSLTELLVSAGLLKTGMPARRGVPCAAWSARQSS
jgi:hypothetical protein